MNQYLAILLTTLITFASCGLTNAQYSGTQAYNHPQAMHASVNIATGTFHFSYPLVKHDRRSRAIHHQSNLPIQCSGHVRPTNGLAA